MANLFQQHPAATQRAIALRKEGLTHKEIAIQLRQETGIWISDEGVRQHLVKQGVATELGAFGTTPGTRLSRGRRALLMELSKLGRKCDMEDLAGAGTGPDRAAALLRAMRKQGLVSFQESVTARSSNGVHHRHLARIEITDKGRAALLRAKVDDVNEAAIPLPPPHSPTMAEFDVVQQTADDIMQAKMLRDVDQAADAIMAFVDELEAPAAVDLGAVAQDFGEAAPAPAEPLPPAEEAPWLAPTEQDDWRNPWREARAGLAYSEWPVLHNLLQRQARQVRLAGLLREAAELTDDETLGVTLLEHADTIPGLSDIELEYLRFADAHHGPTQAAKES